jgi:phage-related protein
MEVAMKRMHVFLVLVMATLAIGFAGNARAQGWDWNGEDSVRQFQSFDSFLRDHPWIAKKLWEKPQRVNDRDFANDNKEIKQWLEDHPAAARAFHDDPAGFMERERHFQTYGADFGGDEGPRRELARFDWFLDGHPGIRHDLMRKPDLIDKREYLEHHRDLAEFLERHPALARELQEHPREFMEREGGYEHTERPM